MVPCIKILGVEPTTPHAEIKAKFKELTGEEYLAFGQDGTGGLAAIWCAREGCGLLDHPIVFFGSEGDLGVVAENFSSFLWLLAGGFGPFEAVAYPEENREANTTFTEFARRHAGAAQIKPQEVIARARQEFSTFEENVRSSCR